MKNLEQKVVSCSLACMRKSIKLALAVGVPLLVLAWAAFRPERLFLTKYVNEPTPVGVQMGEEWGGRFASFAHETVGRADVLEVGDKRILRLSEFRTTNGPDVRVLLVEGKDAKNLVPGRFVDLGALKGNAGSQNYAIPVQFDPVKYGAVVIWCRRFNVSFGGANLMRT